jgi:hypothetical protein
MKTTFVRFVLKYKNDYSPYGDLARDMIVDQELKRTWGYKTTKKYLICMNACDKVMELLEDLREKYNNKYILPSESIIKT